MTQTALSVVKTTGEISPSQLVQALSPQDKATIMSLCMPKGSTDSELALYLYRCKELGFDPLSKELVLQKRISQKDGSVNLSFITTRDALLRKAELNPNYAGLNSGVVRENDTFLVDTEKGVVKHTFGAQRGKIMAGWAVVYHKTRLPVVSIADYTEYARANCNSPVWQAMPSAMIQKVAEVAALRRQFPILTQGLYTAEELEHEPVLTPGTVDETLKNSASSPVVVEMKPVSEQVSEPEQAQNQEYCQVSEQVPPVLEEVPAAPEPEVVAEIVTEASNAEPQATDAFKLLGFNTGKSGTGTPYAKILCEKDGHQQVFLAKGEEGLVEVGKLRESCMFKAETFEESGFNFLRSVTVIE